MARHRCGAGAAGCAAKAGAQGLVNEAGALQGVQQMHSNALSIEHVVAARTGAFDGPTHEKEHGLLAPVELKLESAHRHHVRENGAFRPLVELDSRALRLEEGEGSLTRDEQVGLYAACFSSQSPVLLRSDGRTAPKPGGSCRIHP